MTTVTTTHLPAAGAAASSLLRTVLRIDAWGTAAFGVFLLAAGSVLSGPLGLPMSWSVPFGVAMLGGAAALALIAGYPTIPPRLPVAVVAGNTASAVALVVLTVSGAIPLTALGVVFMLTGAVIVAIFAELEFVGLRRVRNAGTASAS